MNLKNILLFITLLITTAAYAQKTNAISGTVVDKDKMPLAGVTVIVDGTGIGTTTNTKGYFTINAPQTAKSITFSYLGYEPQSVTIGAQTVINVVLNENAVSFDAIQVVAYGTKEKVTITGAISSMSGADVLKSPNASITNSLSGAISGVSSVQTIGQPGLEDAKIFIRGTGSLSEENSSPLILVDGVERSFSQLDPNEIADITVLKDASSTAVFGVRGANGVLLVTTKRGVIGKPKISVSSSLSFQSPAKLYEMADSYTTAMGYNEQSKNDGGVKALFSDYALNAYRTGSDPILYPNTNWLEYCFKDNYIQNQNNINISGGTDRVKYFVSVGYLYQDGLLKRFEELPYDNNYLYNRYNYRTNLDIDVTKTTKFSINLGGVLGVRQEPRGHDDGLWRWIIWSQPFSSPGAMGGSRIVADKRATGADITMISGLNSFYGLGNRTRHTSDLNVDLGVTQQLDAITKGLKVTIKGAYNTNYFIQKNRNYNVLTKTASYKGMNTDPTMDMNDPNYDKSLVYKTTGSLIPMSYDESTGQGRNWYMEGSLNYNRKFEDHSVSALLLYNQSKTYYPKSFSYIPRAYVGLVGRIGYDYKKRYMAEFNAGYNGSENFAPGDTRFGFFPAVSAGWVISEEKFMKKQKFIDYIKVRASFGLVGNDNYGEVGANRFLYMPDSYSINQGGYNFGTNTTTNQLSANENKLGNPSVSWETATKQNYGIDIKVLKNRLSLSTDFFYDKREDILITKNTPPDIIAMSLPVLNLGEVHNKGFEIEFKWQDKVNNFRYWFGTTISHARNKIIYMDEVAPKNYYMAQTGRQTGINYGYVFERFYDAYDFEDLALGKLVEGLATAKIGNYILQPGDVKYYDLDRDGDIDTDDMTYMGFPENPEYIFGINAGFSWKGFDFSMLWIGATNSSRMLDNEYRNPFSGGGIQGLMQYMWDDRWTPETAGTATFPRFTNNNRRHNFAPPSSLWIRDASYIRLKNINLSYTFSNFAWMKSSGLDNLTVSLTGSNMFTFDGLKIIDPESRPRGSNTNQYPISKIVSLGVKLNF